MKLLSNISGVLCALLALAAVGSSLPTVIDVSAEDFMNMTEIHVRSDGTRVSRSPNDDTYCGRCIPYWHYKKVGTGNPHQNFVITQKGGTLVSCTTAGTSTTAGHSTTLSWSISTGVNSAFSSAGFSISSDETYTVANTFNCNGVAAEGGDICVLFYQAVTAFTVDVIEMMECQCGGSHSINRGNAVVYAPNSHQLGSIAGRGINVISHHVEQCVGDSDRRVNYYCGPPGGPDWWTGKGAGPWTRQYVQQRVPAGCHIPIEAMKFDD